VDGGDVEDEDDGLAARVVPGHRDERLLAGVWYGLRAESAAIPDAVVEVGEHDVGTVDLVADGGEVVADGAEGPTAGPSGVTGR
jgi:hypothetical protein